MEVGYHRKFIKNFGKLSSEIQEAFYEKLEIFCKDKKSNVLNNHKLHGKLKNLRSINVTGDYRALFKENRNEIIFMKVGTHSELFN
jgi:addiction module RelE/StbE family toxin